MTLVFSHANGYPPGSYRVLLEALEETMDAPVVSHAHRPLTTDQPAPIFLSWHEYANDLIQRIERESLGPVWLVGHSMGGATGVLAAAKRPDLFSGLIGLDPVLPRTKLWFWSRVVSWFKPDAVPIVKRALARPHDFDSQSVAFDFYRGKRVFSSLSDEVLMDYVKAGHQLGSDGREHLRYSGAWEACVYRSVPRIRPALNALQCPTLIIAGEQSQILTSETLSWLNGLNSRLTTASLLGGHLLPLESPEICAEAVATFIRAQEASHKR